MALTLGRRSQAPLATPADCLALAQSLALSQRYREALAMIQGQAEWGDREAQRALGEMLFHGEPTAGIPEWRDRAEAERWFRLAATQGCPVSRYYLDWYYDDNRSSARVPAGERTR